MTASLRDAPAIAFGDVIGAKFAICFVALGTGALIAPLPFDLRGHQAEAPRRVKT